MYLKVNSRLRSTGRAGTNNSSILTLTGFTFGKHHWGELTPDFVYSKVVKIDTAISRLELSLRRESSQKDKNV